MDKKRKWGRIVGVFLCLLSFVGFPYFLTSLGGAVYVIFALRGQTLQASILASAVLLVVMISIFIIGYDSLLHRDEEDTSDHPYPTVRTKLAAVACFGAGAGVLTLLMMQDNAPVVAYMVAATIAAWFIMLLGVLARRHYDRIIPVEIFGPGMAPEDVDEESYFVPQPSIFGSTDSKAWPQPHPIHGSTPSGSDHH